MERIKQTPESSIPELAALRQYIAELDLTPVVRHTLEAALNQSEKQLGQQLARTTQQAERFCQLGQMAAKMVHELRNPLNAIFLHADVLEEEVRLPSPDSRTQVLESVGEIRTEVARLYTIMQDYLALVRLEVIDRPQEELGPALQDWVQELQAQLETRRIKLHLESLGRLGRIPLHQGTMRRAILNLLQYALDTMPVDGRLTLRGHRSASQVTIAVEYSGRSIPEEQWRLLFEPFQETGSEWTGLGLYVVREIVKAHQGTIDVRSTPEQTTTFTITLPLTLPEAMPGA
jgi:two-component system, NtrC family, sensor histidine kinase HydH